MFHQFSSKKCLIQEEEMEKVEMQIGGKRGKGQQGQAQVGQQPTVVEKTLPELAGYVSNLNHDQFGIGALNAIINRFNGFEPPCKYDISNTQNKNFGDKKSLMLAHINSIKNDSDCKDIRIKVATKSAAGTAPAAPIDPKGPRYVLRSTSGVKFEDVESLGNVIEELIVKFENDIRQIIRNPKYLEDIRKVDPSIPKRADASTGTTAGAPSTTSETQTTIYPLKYERTGGIETQPKTFKKVVEDTIEKLATWRDEKNNIVAAAQRAASDAKTLVSLAYYIKNLEDIFEFLNSQVNPNLQKVKSKLGMIIGFERPVESETPEQIDAKKADEKAKKANCKTDREPKVLHINTIDNTNKDEYLENEKLESLFSLKEGEYGRAVFYFNTSNPKDIAKEKAWELLEGLNGFGFQTFLKWYCHFMKEDDITNELSTSQERFVMKYNILPFLMKFKSGFNEPYNKFDYNTYISSPQHKKQIAFLMIVHQAHFVGKIYESLLYEATSEIKVPNFNLNEGDESNIEENSNKILIEKFRFVKKLYDRLNELVDKNGNKYVLKDDSFSSKPKDLLDKFDEFIQYVYKELQIPNWRSMNFKFFVKSLTDDLLKAKRTEFLETPDVPKLTTPGVPALPTSPAEESELQKELDEIIKEKPHFKEKIEIMKGVMSLKEILKSIKTQSEAEKLKSSKDVIDKINEEFMARLIELQRSVMYYATKNGRTEIFNNKLKELSTRSKDVAFLNPDDLDSIVKDVFKEIERIYEGLPASSKKDFTIKNNFERNAKEKNELLNRIYAYKTDVSYHKA
jgi:hypothetical protein